MSPSSVPTMREMARKLLDGSPDGQHGLRLAYEQYIARASWVSFELFELGIQILAEDGE